MVRKAARFLSLFCLGLAAGMVLSQVLRAAPQSTLPAETYMLYQRTMLRGHKVAVCVLEPAAVLAALAWAFTAQKRREGVLALAGLICAGVMFALWVLFVRPIGNEIALWERDFLPPDWMEFRSRWALLQAVRAGIAFVGFGALCLAAITNNGEPVARVQRRN